MNKYVPPKPAAAAGTPPPDLIPLVLPHIGKPDAEQLIKADVSDDFRKDHPAYAGLPAIVDDLEEHFSQLRTGRKRHAHEKSRAKLLEPDVHTDQLRPLSGYERAQFYFFLFATLFGIAMSMHALASYISDSDIISFLSGNYFGSLFMSGVPLIAVLALKSRAFTSLSDEAEHVFYGRLLFFGLVSFVVYVLAASNVFWPHKADAAAIVAALANGAEPSNWFADFVKSVGERVVFGSQIFSETLLAPVAALRADMIHRSRQVVTLKLSKAQIAHDTAIKGINNDIALVKRELFEAQAQLAAYKAMERAHIDAALGFYRNVTADQKRASDDVIAKHSKKGG